MKPTFRFIIVAVAAISVFASCQKAVETAVPEAGDIHAGGLRVTGRMAEMETKTSFTKEVDQLTPHWKVGDKIIGLWGADKTVIWTVKELSENNVVFAYVSGTEPWENGTEVSVIYAPGRSSSDIEGTGDGRTLAFDLSHQAGTLESLGNYSLMTGKGTVNDSSLPLTFSHSIAVLSLDKLKDLTPDESGYSVSIESDSLSNCGTFGFGSNGALTFTGGPKGGRISTGATFTSNGSGELDSVFFAVPEANLTGADIAVSVSKGTDTLNYNLPVNRVMTAGHYYYRTLLQSDFDITTTGTENAGVYTVDGGTYTIQSGDPLADVKKAKAGELITVIPSSPDIGHSDGTVTVTVTDTGVDVPVNGNTFTMPAASVTVTVTFPLVPYAINGSVTPESSGTVTFKKSGSDAGIQAANYNDEITVEAAPNTGYELESIKWKVGGGNETDITSGKKFTMPAEAVNVTVTFKKTDYSIIKSTSVTNGSFIVKKDDSDVTTANYQDVITIEATPDEGYVLVSITVKDTDNIAVAVTNGKFRMPAKNVTVTVAFESFTGTINGHDYVLIGGKKWATMNLGANSLTDNGSLYAWGEISPKTSFSQDNYTASDLSTDIGAKSNYDAAYMNWGDTWRMPTKKDFADLFVQCYAEIGTYNDKEGLIVYIAKDADDAGCAFYDGKMHYITPLYTWNTIGKDRPAYSTEQDKFLFFPLVGIDRGNGIEESPSSSCYWVTKKYSNMGAIALRFDKGILENIDDGVIDLDTGLMRSYGCPVRPVSD